MIEDPDEQAVIGFVKAMRTNGRSLRQIAGALNEEGMAPKRSGEWHPMKVKRVLDRIDSG